MTKAKDTPNIPKLPGFKFGSKQSMFSGNKGFAGKSPTNRFIPPVIRITQNKGGGGK